MDIKYIRLAHERGLGIGEPDEIKLAGDFDDLPNFGFETKKSPVVFFDQVLRTKLSKYLPFLEKLIFHTPLFNVPIFASGFYHDKLWYPTIGKKRISEFMNTQWGQHFGKYEFGKKPDNQIKVWNSY